MMDTPESLQTIAEISIAFAGFTGLIVALRKNDGPMTAVHKYRLQILLTLAFGAMFLSLLPDLLGNYGFPPEHIWPLSSAVLSVYSVVFLYWWITSSRRIMQSYPALFNWFAFSRMAAGHVLVVLLQLTVVFSLIRDIGAAAYISALIWYLLHAAQQFARMLFIQPE